MAAAQTASSVAAAADKAADRSGVASRARAHEPAACEETRAAAASGAKPLPNYKHLWMAKKAASAGNPVACARSSAIPSEAHAAHGPASQELQASSCSRNEARVARDTTEMAATAVTETATSERNRPAKVARTGQHADVAAASAATPPAQSSGNAVGEMLRDAAGSGGGLARSAERLRQGLRRSYTIATTGKASTTVHTGNSALLLAVQAHQQLADAAEANLSPVRTTYPGRRATSIARDARKAAAERARVGARASSTIAAQAAGGSKDRRSADAVQPTSFSRAAASTRAHAEAAIVGAAAAVLPSGATRVSHSTNDSKQVSGPPASTSGFQAVASPPPLLRSLDPFSSPSSCGHLAGISTKYSASPGALRRAATLAPSHGSTANASAASASASGVSANNALRKNEPKYAYKEVVRGREAREALRGFDCDHCRRFFEMLLENGFGVEAADIRQAASRHRHRFSPARTPEGYWELNSLPDELPVMPYNPRDEGIKNYDEWAAERDRSRQAENAATTMGAGRGGGHDSRGVRGKRTGAGGPAGVDAEETLCDKATSKKRRRSSDG